MNSQKYKTEYEQVDITDYIRILRKRKKLIFALFLIAVIGAGVYSFFIAPEIYKLETYLEIGTINRKGAKALIEQTPQIVEKIKSGVYGDYPNIEAFSPKSTNLIRIETESKNPEDAKKALENINKEILADHNSKIDFQKNILNKEKDEINSIIENLEKDVASLMFKNQQIAGLRLKIYDFQLSIDMLEREMEAFQSTKIIKELKVSERPVSPRPLFNIIIAGGLGIFLGAFLAFGKEWSEKVKIANNK